MRSSPWRRGGPTLRRRQERLRRRRQRGHTSEDHRRDLLGAGKPSSFSFSAATPIRRAAPGSEGHCLRGAPPAGTLPDMRAAQAPGQRPAGRDRRPRDRPSEPSSPASRRRGTWPIRHRPESPVRVETTMSTLSARNRRSANRTARNEGRSTHCRSSRTSTTTRSSACRRSTRSSKRTPTAIGSSPGSLAASGSSCSTTP